MKKQRLLSFILLICVICALPSLASCKQNGTGKQSYTAYSLDYFDTAISIIGQETDEETFNEISGRVLAILGEYDRLYTIYSRYDSLENLCTVNDLVDGAHRTVTVDRRIIDLLLYSKEMYELTGGKMNVAMGSVLSIWHDYRTEGMSDPANAKLPSESELAEAAKHTNIDDVIIDEEACTVFLADPKMTLDVGAVAKGYAVEMAARYLEEQGVTGYVINAGGNVRTVGTKANGDQWTVGIENPDRESDEAYVALLGVADRSVVSSGTYQRYYMVNGNSYHHIIDSDTLFPSLYYLSVSVVCQSSALGDALSTALFCLPLEDGMALVESLPDVEALWVLPDQSMQTSAGFEGYLKQTD